VVAHTFSCQLLVEQQCQTIGKVTIWNKGKQTIVYMTIENQIDWGFKL